ncbi:YafY family protein [Nocardia sp. BMG51109]|uniref:helix-turn-helix transcriptional regulator n=1 Tax=Nocardia sp. BMG51109 TaxID=1056816 RepID=UPI000464EB1B|nr:WYL domain-containing protein [Nocardia sp. BMG51109]
MTPDRFFALLMALQTQESVTTDRLAEQLGVSVRTVLRDLNWLRDAGFPLVVQRGRRGGVTLLPGGSLDTSRLTPEERDHLALSGLDAAQRHELGVSRESERIQQKVRTRSRRSAENLLPLSAVVIPDNSPWSASVSPGAAPAAMVHDLRRGVRLRINYRRSTEERSRWRVVDPYGLLAKAGTWYLVADRAGRPGLYRLDRLTQWQPLRTARRLRPGTDLADVAAALVQQWTQTYDLKIHAEIVIAQLDRAKRILGHQLTIRPDHVGNPAQRVPITVSLRSIEDVRVLLQFGNTITVTAPDEARQHIIRLAQEVADHYS